MTVILGIETATPQVACGMAGPEGVIATFSAAVGRRHGEALAPAIQFLVAQTGITLHQVDAIAVDVGPGLFTGLRVGVATAQALGTGLGVGAVEVSSLDILAYPYRNTPRPVLAVVDARRAEVFWARYDAGVRVGEPAVATPEELAEQLAAGGETVLAVGDGARRYTERFEAVPGVSVEAGRGYPAIESLLALAAEALERGAALPAGRLAARYLRQADVRIGWAQAPAVGRSTPARSAANGSPAAPAAGGTGGPCRSGRP